MASGSKWVIYGAIAANVAIAVSKFIAAGVTGSSAMISEGIHSTVDTGDGLLLLLGQHRARKPPDEMHPFGHGGEIYFWSLMVAIVIFGLGGGMSFYEGISRLRHPRPSEDPTWNYVVLAIAAVFESISFVIGVREVMNRKDPGETIWRRIRRSKDPSVFTVVLEDSAALIGLLIAFIGIFVGHLLGTPIADAIASLAIGILLAGVALFLISQSKGLLIGEGADPEKVEALRRLVTADPAVESAGELLTLQLAPKEVLLNLEVRFRDELSRRELEAAIQRLESTIREGQPDITRVFIEAQFFRRGALPSNGHAACGNASKLES
jgi:cation diffusion facilitator family transporter